MGRNLRTVVTIGCVCVGLLGAAGGTAAASGPHPKKVNLHKLYAKLAKQEKKKPVKELGARTSGAAAAAGIGPLAYNGGSVQSTPQVYLLFWGPSWSTTGSDFTYLDDFLTGLGQEPADDWSTIMEQYGVPAGYPGFGGSVLRGVFLDTSTPPYGVTQPQLAAEADALYASQSLTDAANTQIVVATPAGTCPAGFYSPSCPSGGTYCAWHSYTSVHSVPFTNMPYVVDSGGGCGEDSVNPAPRGTYDGFSIVEGHEYAETVTDPYLNAWLDSSGDEIGDKCAWLNLFDLSLPTGTFAMQPLWSNRANGCAQATSVGPPGAPAIGSATAGAAGSGQATVSFTGPGSDGNATIMHYTVTAHDATNSARGGETATGTTSPIVVGGLSPGDSYTFTVTATNVNGTGSPSAASNAVVLTASGGVPGTLQAQFVVPSTLAAAASPVTDPYSFSWAQGTCSSTATYTLKESVNGGAFTTVYTGTGKSKQLPIPLGNLYTFQVSCGGSPSQTTFRVSGYQETAGTYTGTWTKTSFTGAWGGSATYSTTNGASVTFTCTCEAVAWVTDEDSTHGSAKVYVDGALKTTVSTKASAKKNAVVVYKFGWATDGPHSLKIVNVATSGHPRVSVDGFLTRTTS
jgi:serine protease